jgi:hypothetical protein
MRIFLIFAVTLLGIHSCTAQVTSPEQPKNPCDPPPPCLPVKEQPFSFVFEWKASKRNSELPKVISSPTQKNEDGPIVTLPMPQAADTYRVLFNDPSALSWQDKNRFTAYLQTGKRIDTLHFTVKELIRDCCPQLVILKIYQNGKCICEDCPAKQPVKWRR